MDSLLQSSKIIWYNLNKEGYIIGGNNNIMYPLFEKGGIYVYRFNDLDKEELYIGSTINIKQRFRQHKYRAEIYQREFNYNSMLYDYVMKYGWNCFKFGVIEYINLNHNLDFKDKRKIILYVEQRYLDLLTPTLNTNKFAGSMRGFKHSDKTKKNYGIARTGKCYRKIKGVIIRPEVSQETVLKLKLHSKDKKVYIYKTEGVSIKEFTSIKATAKFVGLSPTSVSKYIKSGKLWNNLYYFKLETAIVSKNISFPLVEYKESNLIPIVGNEPNMNRRAYMFEVLVNNQIIYRFKSITKASNYLNISKRTLTNYSINNKLWRDKFEFKIIYPCMDSFAASQPAFTGQQQS